MKNQFIEIPASKQSLAARRPIYGIGINDADYVVCKRLPSGKNKKCPYYEAWFGMLRRCYSAKSLVNRPTYIGCSVCDEWLYFMSFKKWMEKQDWIGKDLDKDIITPGNKIYSPKNCAFVTSSLNNLLSNHKGARGKYPQGVDITSGGFRAQISIYGKYNLIGHYKTVDEAEKAYIIKKVNLILKAANETKDERVSGGLVSHAKIMASKLVGPHQH
jgi:hypothetical protein